MSDQVRLTGVACRAGRALLDWNAKRLCAEASLSARTLNQLEQEDRVSDQVAKKIIATFGAAGVEILNGDAPGARFKPGARP